MDEHVNNLRSLKFKSKANIHFRRDMLKRPVSAKPQVDLFNKSPSRSIKRKEEKPIDMWVQANQPNYQKIPVTNRKSSGVRPQSTHGRGKTIELEMMLNIP